MSRYFRSSQGSFCSANKAPIRLSDEFAKDAQKKKQWNAFLLKNSIAPKPLSEVVGNLRDFLMPFLASAVQR